MNLKKTDVDLFQLDLFPSHYLDFLFADRYDTDTVKFERKVKGTEQCQIEYISFIKQY